MVSTPLVLAMVSKTISGDARVFSMTRSTFWYFSEMMVHALTGIPLSMFFSVYLPSS